MQKYRQNFVVPIFLSWNRPRDTLLEHRAGLGIRHRDRGLGPGLKRAATPAIGEIDRFQNPDLPALAVAEKVETQVKIGDEVFVYGNSKGEGVVTEIRGKVQGIGPDKLEVSAAFVQGNSGSPIISTKANQVLAVATYVSVAAPDWIVEGTRFVEPRRFGVRLDNLELTDFQCIDEERYLRDWDALDKAKKRNSIGYLLVKDLQVMGPVPESYDDEKAVSLARLWNREWNAKTKEPTARSKTALQYRVRQIQEYLAVPFTKYPADSFTYNWLRDEYSTEQEFRDLLSKFLTAFNRHIAETTTWQ